MNCKQGDLAIIIKSVAGNEGQIVRCVKFVGRQLFNDGKFFSDVWELDRELPGTSGQKGNKISDSQLRPIRDSDKQDEMLKIAGKPERIPA